MASRAGPCTGGAAREGEPGSLSMATAERGRRYFVTNAFSTT